MITSGSTGKLISFVSFVKTCFPWYLLKKHHCVQFDNWNSDFCRLLSSWLLYPQGKGFPTHISPHSHSKCKATLCSCALSLPGRLQYIISNSHKHILTPWGSSESDKLTDRWLRGPPRAQRLICRFWEWIIPSFAPSFVILDKPVASLCFSSEARRTGAHNLAEL